MDVKGFLEESFGDWDGEPASVIFLPNCNFRCPFCHNVNIVLNPEKLETIPFQYIEEQLVKHKNWRNAVCITGGEPTLQNKLPELCQKLKQMGFKVKLDTNGTNPTMLKELIDKKLIDFVAMDIKAPLTPEKYSEATGVDTASLLEKVKKSIQTLMESNVDYEFRTTVVPTIHTREDIEKICNSLNGCKKYVIQEFDVGIGQETLNPNLKSTSWNEKEIQEFLKIAQHIIPNTKLRGNLRQIET